MKLPANIEKAHLEAVKARSHSYSPYSNFKVGAALKLKGMDEPVGGCNIENASFGATVCAERVALGRARAQYGEMTPEHLVIVTAEPKATVPCALCLQALAEFCADDFQIHLANEQQILKSYSLKDLLPHPFRHFEKDSSK